MPRPVWEQTAAAWLGLRDASDPVAAAADKLRRARNVIPLDATLGTAWVGRPGVRLLGPRVAVGRVQWVGQFTRAAAGGAIVQHTLAVVGGLVYEFSWLTRTWALRALGGGLVLDAGAMVDGIVFANRLILSDGVHKPIAWNGAVFTELSAAPVFYGPLTTYYAKLFGIMATDRRTIAWSNEADPAAGYITDQQWTLAQSDSDPLTRLYGTNEALYVWRARSITAVGGAVDTDFQSSGTREGVSETVGTVSPFAVVSRDRQLFFLSSDARPHVLTPGGGVEDLWRDVRETVDAVPRALLSSALGTWNAALDMVQHHVRELGAAECSLGLWIDPSVGMPVSLCAGWSCTALGEVLDGDERPLMVYGSATGHVYVADTQDGVSLNDDLAPLDGGPHPIEHELTLPPMGPSVAVEKKFDRIDVLLRVTGALSNVTIDVETPYGEQTIAEAVSVSGGLAIWDVALWDVALYVLIRPEVKLSVGVQAHGRWIAPRIRHSAMDETFGVAAVRASGFLLQDPPRAK